MNINWFKVCTVGLKVLLAIGTGVAVFAGVSKATNTGATVNNNNTPNANPSVGSNNGSVQQQGQNTAVAPVNNNNGVDGGKIITGLRATQNSMERIISVIGSIAVAVESISAIFGNANDNRGNGYGYQPNPWNGGWNNYGGWMTPTTPSYSGIGLRQVTPFIQEAGYFPPSR